MFQEDICSPEDILCDGGRGLAALARTLHALHTLSRKDIHPHYTTEDTTDITDQMDTQNSPEFDTHPHYTTDSEHEAITDQNSPQFDTITVNYRRYSEDRYISNFNFVEQNYTFDETEEYQLNDNNNSDLSNDSPQVQYSPVYNNELRIRGPYYHKNKIQFVTPFCKDGILKSDNLEIYDTDEVDFPIELNENIDIDRYDRDKMNLDIQINYVNVVESARDREYRIFYTCLCLGGFIVSAILLILYPL